MTTFNPDKDGLPSFYSGDNYVIEESIGYLIRQAHLAIHRTIDANMADLDLTALQWVPLLFLAKGKGQTAAELSRCVCVDTSTMTRMLDRLEAKGLLERKRSMEDRRVIFLELTDEGRRLAQQVPYRMAATLNQHLRDFNQQQIDDLKLLLRRIIANGEN